MSGCYFYSKIICQITHFYLDKKSMIKTNISIWTEMLNSNKEHRSKFEYQPWAMSYKQEEYNT